MGSKERGFQVEDVTVVSERGGSYIIFTSGSVVSGLPAEQRPGVTFGGLVHGVVDDHNNSKAFGVDEVRVTGIEGVDGGNGRREAWSMYRPMRWDPTKQTVLYVSGGEKAVNEVIAGAKAAARELQTAVSRRQPVRVR